MWNALQCLEHGWLAVCMFNISLLVSFSIHCCIIALRGLNVLQHLLNMLCSMGLNVLQHFLNMLCSMGLNVLQHLLNMLCSIGLNVLQHLLKMFCSFVVFVCNMW